MGQSREKSIVPAKKTTLYLLPSVAEGLLEDTLIYTENTAVVNAALWMFHHATPDAREKAIVAVSRLKREIQAADAVDTAIAEPKRGRGRPRKPGPATKETRQSS